MLNFFAIIIDHVAARFLLGAFGLWVGYAFSPMILFLLVSGTLQGVVLMPMFAIGCSLGLLGWMGRVCVPSGFLSQNPLWASTLCVFLLIGTSISAFLWISLPNAGPLFGAMTSVGALLFLGTLGSAIKGPGSSSDWAKQGPRPG